MTVKDDAMIRAHYGHDLDTATDAGAPWEQMLGLSPLYESDGALHADRSCVCVRGTAQPFAPQETRVGNRTLYCCPMCRATLIPAAVTECWGLALRASITIGYHQRVTSTGMLDACACAASVLHSREAYRTHADALSAAIAGNVGGPDQQVAAIALDWVRSTFERYRDQVEDFAKWALSRFDATGPAERDHWALFPVATLCRSAKGDIERSAGAAAVLWPQAASAPDGSWTVASAPARSRWFDSARREHLIVPLGPVRDGDDNIWGAFPALYSSGLSASEALLAARAIAL